MVYIGMCGPKGYGCSAVLVINELSILAILVSNRVWFFTLVLNWVRVFIIADKTIIKSPIYYVLGNCASQFMNFCSGHS